MGCSNNVGVYSCVVATVTMIAVVVTMVTAGPSSCYDVHGCQHYCKKTPAGIRCGCRDGYKLHSDGKRCLRTYLKLDLPAY